MSEFITVRENFVLDERRTSATIIVSTTNA